MNENNKKEWGNYKTVKQLYDWGRTYTYYRLKAGDIKGVLIREKTSGPGKRLFYLPSISDYLMREMEKQAPTSDNADNSL